MKWLEPMLLAVAGMVVFLVLTEARQMPTETQPADTPVTFALF